MKLVAILTALFFAIASLCFAGEPSLEVYQVIPGDAGAPRGELIMKLNNPSGQTYYVAGYAIGGPYYDIEVQKDGKWESAPRTGVCGGTGPHFRPLLQGSYLVFNTYLPKSIEDFAIFRVTIRIDTASPFELVEKPSTAGEKTYIDLVSEPFFTRDLRPVKAASASPSSDNAKPHSP